MNILFHVASVLLVAGSLAHAATNASPEMAAVAANDRIFETAYAKEDVKTIIGLFAEDADYISSAGLSFKGRDEIRNVIQAGFQANKGAKLVIRTDSVRLLAPDVLVGTGSTAVTSKNGEVAGELFSAIYVRKDGNWKISHLVETVLPEVTPAERLSELAWLLGDWSEAEEEAGLKIHSHYQLAHGGAFISRNVTVTRGKEPVLEGWQVIGWSPVEKTIRSWTFDDAGGFSEGIWTREGERWLIREKGYSGDGARTTSEQTITKSGDDKFYWESGNRTLDGEPMPGIGRILIQRVKGK